MTGTMTGQRYVSAWDNGMRNLGAHWIKEGSGSKSDTLDTLMLMDHVIRVDADGLVHDDARGMCAPEINMQTDDTGSIFAEHDAALIADLERQGWTAETGWTGQYGDHKTSPVMHTSEFIGGSLAEHIVTTPGYWVACAVDVDSEVCPNDSPTCKLSDPCVICTDGTGDDRERDTAGWVLLHHPVHVEQADLIGNIHRGRIVSNAGPSFTVEWESGLYAKSTERYDRKGEDWREASE